MLQNAEMSYVRAERATESGIAGFLRKLFKQRVRFKLKTGRALNS